MVPLPTLDKAYSLLVERESQRIMSQTSHSSSSSELNALFTAQSLVPKPRKKKGPAYNVQGRGRSNSDRRSYPSAHNAISDTDHSDFNRVESQRNQGYGRGDRQYDPVDYHKGLNSNPPTTVVHSEPTEIVPAQDTCSIRRSQRSTKAPLWLQDYVASAHLQSNKPLYSIDKYIGYDNLSSSYRAFFSSFVYVDDLMITGNDISLIQQSKSTLQENFKMKDIGNLRYFLGIEFARSQDGIVMHQKKYTLEIISEAGLSAAKPAATPLDPYVHLTTREYDELNGTSKYDKLLTDPAVYRRLVGKLLYLNVTRPDISFTTQTLSQFLHQPKQSHLNAALKVVIYIKSQAGLGVLLSSTNSKEQQVYCDSD
uniref:Reverse transcriptase Ty1/copia-type domain-containing protein n=1 Tax=Solanum lycopersicum TaxID=4081 RepID=A0A3Q7FZR3_SOLLC